ncbi:AsmA-like C-terminal region-containing protein [Candidatus Pelagibacter ubique]|nr:AsmA-like C-terminal region-containing protein [Candidatus Pelagibacter ubique]
MKRIVKILVILILTLAIIVIYLSLYGVKTDKFNKEIIKNVSKINKKINLSLNEVNYLLNPLNFSINISTKNPKILLEDKSLDLKDITSNISLKSFISNQFSIDDLKISTKEIKIKDLISLTRAVEGSPQLFVLDNITKEGLISADINLKFDLDGEIKNNYQITGTVKKAKFNIFNKVEIDDLNLLFNISNNQVTLKKIETNLNSIKLKSPLIKIEKKKDIFFVDGEVANEEQNFDINKLKPIFGDLPNNIEVEKIDFNSVNIFSFNVNKKLKLNNLKLETNLNLENFQIVKNPLNLKTFLPNYTEQIKFKDHKIKIKLIKGILDIRGDGDINIGDESEQLSYSVIKDDRKITFDTNLNIKNNPLTINFLDYKKKKGNSSEILLKGIYRKNKELILNDISITEKNNQILIRDLLFSKNFKVKDLSYIKLNYRNKNDLLNSLELKKNKSNFSINGKSFDATQLINNSMSDDESTTIFENFNSKFNIKIGTTYINKNDYTKNLAGYFTFKNNKLDKLNLASTFSNNKKMNLSIETNNQNETITKFFSNYPKPLIKRYDFIKGFEEGYLNFNSIKKDGVSNSVLIIDNFKVKEVPVFAKLLSLASLQGIADLLTGEGIRFTDFEMRFSSQKGLTNIEEMYAIGPAISILMDGYIESKKLVSLRGTLVPATTINRSIASIPLLGKILIGEKTGEGVFGVSFKIKGPPKNLSTTVNPIKTLTPRFITRTLEKIKKN